MGDLSWLKQHNFVIFTFTDTFQQNCGEVYIFLFISVHKKLSQRDRATTAWVSFGQNITGRAYSAPNLIGLSSTTET